MNDSSPSMPQLIYGTAWKKDRTADLVEAAVLAGFRGIDTACQPKHYDEAGVGQALNRLASLGIERDALFIQTKFTPVDGQDPQRIPYDPAAALEDQVRQSVTTSLRNLGVARIDSLVLHSPLRSFKDTLRVWASMEELQRAGIVGQLGMSNCYDVSVFMQLYEAAQVKPAVIQNRFYAETSYDKELRSMCRKQGIGYQSFWTLTANPHLLQAAPLLAFAQQRHKTPAQILFRLLIGAGLTPLTGTSNPQHMREDLEALAIDMPTDQVQQLMQALGI